MFEAPHYSVAGAKRDTKFALPADYFDGDVNEPVLHQAVRAFLNNQRQGTHQTKTRSFVSGGNQKPWKQKGTGRARQGSIRAPHWRGGGVVFGPHPRDYTTDVPRKVRQLARRSALNARAREGDLHVIERVLLQVPRTRELVGLLDKLGVAERKALVLTADHNPNAYLSCRNLPNVDVMRYAEASAYDILWADVVVVEEGAITGVIPEVELPLPGDGAQVTPKKKAAKKAAAEPAAKKAPKKSAKKPAARHGATPKSAKKSAGKSAAKHRANAKPTARKKKGKD
jgi:large subunit ribosomal protein L4